jgi:hypothetical protein
MECQVGIVAIDDDVNISLDFEYRFEYAHGLVVNGRPLWALVWTDWTTHLTYYPFDSNQVSDHKQLLNS